MTTKVTTNLIDQSGNLAFNSASVSLGNVANLHITGGNVGEVLTTDGTGNLSFTSGGGGGGGSTAAAVGYSLIFGG